MPDSAVSRRSASHDKAHNNVVFNLYIMGLHR